MRKTLITLSGLAVVLACSLYISSLYDESSETAVISPIVEPTIENIIVEQPEDSVAMIAIEKPAEKQAEPIVVNEQEMAARLEELNLLIDQYNQNLGNLEKRAEIQQQASIAAESYKREVLAKVKSLKK